MTDKTKRKVILSFRFIKLAMLIFVLERIVLDMVDRDGNSKYYKTKNG